MLPFDYSLNYKELDLRKHPELYRMGRGEQGVLLVEPYKSEILPFWKFKTPELAKRAVIDILKLFRQYRSQNDFAGMDMARKFIQMGYTRSRRYANHKTGKKYEGSVPADKKGISGAHGRRESPRAPDPLKARSAEIFYSAWQKIKADRSYKSHIAQYKQSALKLK